MKQSYNDILYSHEPLQSRKNNSDEKLKEISAKFKTCNNVFSAKPTTIYCVGSLGRGEVGCFADLDLFVSAAGRENEGSRLREHELLASVISTNRDLGYGDFSNDGQYLKIYYKDEMLNAVGRPLDDSENLFTARMLLLLESKFVYNESFYKDLTKDVVALYFRDSKNKDSFKPLFLINDILRYWRTLCLNYEKIRKDGSQNWRKKNINLKFSRMLTVFATILPLIAQPANEQNVRNLIPLTPHERLAFGLDLLSDVSLQEKYRLFLNNYEAFLSWKDQSEPTQGQFQENAGQISKEFSSFLYHSLMHKSISEDYKRYLVL